MYVLGIEQMLHSSETRNQQIGMMINCVKKLDQSWAIYNLLKYALEKVGISPLSNC